MSATIAAIDMPAWATMAVAVGLIGALDRIVFGRRREWLSRRKRITDMPRHRVAGAVAPFGRGKRQKKRPKTCAAARRSDSRGPAVQPP